MKKTFLYMLETLDLVPSKLINQSTEILTYSSVLFIPFRY